MTGSGIVGSILSPSPRGDQVHPDMGWTAEPNPSFRVGSLDNSTDHGPPFAGAFPRPNTPALRPRESSAHAGVRYSRAGAPHTLQPRKHRSV